MLFLNDHLKIRKNQNQNPKQKHLMSIFKSVSRINQFHPIHHLICVKLLNELSKNMNKELSKKNQLWMDLQTGESGILPFEYFKSQSNYLKDFLRNHRNIKVRFVLVCLMEKKERGDKGYPITVQDKAYFHSDTHTNLESTDVKQILVQVIRNILDRITIYQQNGSGWYFKEVVHFEIHTVNFNPMRGSSYIPLPDWIMRKKAII